MKCIELKKALIQRYEKQGEKTSWSFIEIEASKAEIIHSSDKKSFRGKGTLDHHDFGQIALMPMGNGNYILPLNAAIRKKIGKNAGDFVWLVLSKDESEWQMNADLDMCLRDVPNLYEEFSLLPKGHQRYFSNWIESAKSQDTRADRIHKTIYAIANKMDYAQMIRHFKKQ